MVLNILCIASCKILTAFPDVVRSVQALVQEGGGEWFYQVKCLVSNNRGVEKSDCTGEERHPVWFLVAAGLDHSVVKAAPQNIHSFTVL